VDEEAFKAQLKHWERGMPHSPRNKASLSENVRFLSPFFRERISYVHSLGP
jgi:hypothetical protein